MNEISSLSRYAMPIRQQMLMVFTLVMTAFSILLAISIDSSLQRNAISRIGQKNSQDAKFFSNLIDHDIEDQLSSIKATADYLDDMGLTRNISKLEEHLAKVIKSNPAYSWIGYADSSGTILADTGQVHNGQNLSKQAWFKGGKIKPTIIDVRTSSSNSDIQNQAKNNPIRFIDVSSPVNSKNNENVGVLVAYLSVDWLNEQMVLYARSLLKNNDYKPSIVGSDGILRFGIQHEEGLISTVKRKQKNSGNEVSWFEYESESEGEIVISFSKNRGSLTTEDIGWTTLISTPMATVHEELYNTRIIALTSIFLACFTAWVTLWLLLRVSGNPIRLLMKEIKKSRKTLTPLTVHSGLPSEFTEIAESINEFLDSIQSRGILLEQSLSDLKDSFTGVTESFPGVLFRLEELDKSQRFFTYLSPSANEYLNLDLSVMPLPIYKFGQQVDENQRLEFMKILSEQLIIQTDLNLTMEIKGQDGKTRRLRILGKFRIQASGKKIWAGVMVDVTDLYNALNLAAAADKAKSKFLATMSHEIRTPLNGILGFSQILLDEVSNQQQKADVQKIIDTSETLTSILNDILDFSKIEEGKIQLEARPFNLLDLVESSTSMFHIEAKKRQLDFIVEMKLGHSLRLLGDPIRLRQILNNLLSNAIKFTANGQVCLTVSTTELDNERCNLCIFIEDTGIGMNPEFQTRLFQRFEQSDASTFRRFGGSGLGLAIVKGLVDAMGGSIKVKSAIEVGTTFEIQINLQCLKDNEKILDEESRSVIEKLLVLVVDDVPTNREMMCRLLEKDGHTTFQAENGLEAIELANVHEFDVILMDVDMPICNGLEATKKIRDGSYKSRSAFIIALTGYAFEKDIQDALKSGMNAHLAKPINFKKLRSLIYERNVL